MQEGQPQAIELSDYQVPPYLITTTELHVDINADVTHVTAKLQLKKNPESKALNHHLALNGGKDLHTVSVAVDGRQLLSNEYACELEKLTIFDVSEEFELTTKVDIKPQENTALAGLYQSGDMYCTQCEAEGFRNITWYLDRPDVMSKYTTTIQADKQQYPILLSNGNELTRGELGDKHWVKWQDPFNKPAYLFALVAGHLKSIEDTFTTMGGRPIKLQIFTEAHNIDKVDYAMGSLKRAMRWDEKVYGREYDLDIFMIVAVESFNMGAMENKGLNIFNTSCVLAKPDTTTDAAYQRVEGVVAHEYFHNWSGNRVTCRDWFQLSLKEGFTVFRDQQFSASLGSAVVCRVNDVALLRSAQFPEDAGPIAHPIRPSSYIEINNFYTATVYEKGAEVVRMIRTLLGPERFRSGTDHYFAIHDGKAVTTEDFVRAMEDANEFDLSQFRYWYSQAGTPRLSVASYYDATAKTFTLDISQSCPPTPGQESKAPFHMPVAVGLVDANGKDIAFSTSDLDLAHLVDTGEYTAVLNLREARQQFVFTHVPSKPIPSLLRGFSAPVKVDYHYSRDDLMLLMNHDSDGFNRWEAGQRLAIEMIQEIITQLSLGAAPQMDKRLIQAYKTLLEQAVAYDDDQVDKAMLAAMLILPSEIYLAEVAEEIDVNIIHTARKWARENIAKHLQELLLAVYRLNKTNEGYAPAAKQIAQRALKNVALGYLMQLDNAKIISICLEQFEHADNMTDTSTALRALLNSTCSVAETAKSKALATFYHRWEDDALVVNQWFSMQASCDLPNTLAQVKALMQHPKFTMTNPNRMYALVGAFCVQNPVNFHQLDGSGYQFLADCVLELNGINPQMATRVLTPLTRWQKHNLERQQLMRQQLARILATENLSVDVFEIASKSV